ncbi:hypothetical protein AX777_25860 [Sphingobium yanoikuyae]|uniref:Uncharacterized protein n=1 Tax=Sphingobium yanoikuyae TaxID=13690 RepID=A0A177K2F0_SPHYA|nr:hypothetical protein AX777_25860 [Sphingobium yanoikuyae]
MTLKNLGILKSVMCAALRKRALDPGSNSTVLMLLHQLGLLESHGDWPSISREFSVVAIGLQEHFGSSNAL